MTSPDGFQQAPTTPTPAAGGPAPVKRPWTRWLTPVLALVAALVIGLFGGILIGQNTATSAQASGFSRQGGFGGQEGGFAGRGGTGNGGTGGQSGAPGQGGGAGGFAGLTAGTIVSIDGDTIVVKEQSGTQVTVTTTDSTTVTKTEKAAVKDLKAGETVTVRGQADGSGKVTATSVSEGAGLFGGGQRQGQQGSGN
ncbi:MAG TPA: DUF5666 domain-containing protein [Lacisediminihabitans sp.]|uniref:DUF5666 domain-containing protein n=1 Tax=Lacisediminihabitans sp. TaxID=2787631 RepID=UPI002ED80BE2